MNFAYPLAERNAYGPRMQGVYADAVKISLPLHIRRQQNLQALIAEVGGVTALSLLAGSPRPHLSAVASGDKPIGNRLAAKIEAAAEKPAGWLDRDQAQAAPESGVAHDLSYPKVDTPPITHWEDVVSLEKMPVVPPDLMVEMPDDALAARDIYKGQVIWFKAASHAAPRNVVLIEAEGRRWIRRYTESGTAESLDTAYKSFKPNEFKIVAVMHMRPGSSI